SSARWLSTSSRSSSGLRIRLARTLRALELLLHLLRELRQPAEDLERLVDVLVRREPFELGSGRLEPRQQLLGPPERAVGAVHAPRSRWMLPRIAFPALPASLVEYCFASRTASSITAAGGTSPASSSWTAMRRMFRSTAPSRSAVQPDSAAAAVIRRS